VQWVRKPSPVYPSISRKLNETGTVVVAVYFNAAGLVKRTELAKSSGFDRLDRAAIEAIQRAQITPLAGGSDETTRLFNAPISFSLSE
jgi:protein TonB